MSTKKDEPTACASSNKRESSEDDQNTPSLKKSNMAQTDNHTVEASSSLNQNRELLFKSSCVSNGEASTESCVIENEYLEKATTDNEQQTLNSVVSESVTEDKFENVNIEKCVSEALVENKSEKVDMKESASANTENKSAENSGKDATKRRPISDEEALKKTQEELENKTSDLKLLFEKPSALTIMEMEKDLKELFIRKNEEGKYYFRGHDTFSFDDGEFGIADYIQHLISSRPILFTEGPIYLDFTKCTVNNGYVNNILVLMPDKSLKPLNRASLVLKGFDFPFGSDMKTFTSFKLYIEELANGCFHSKIQINESQKPQDRKKIKIVCDNSIIEKSLDEVVTLSSHFSPPYYFLLKNINVKESVAQNGETRHYIQAHLAAIFVVKKKTL